MAIRSNIILSDISMPIEDGYAFLSQLRKLPHEGKIVPVSDPIYALEEFGVYDEILFLTPRFSCYISPHEQK